MPLAHVGHIELTVPDLERSRWFFTEVLGLFVSEETDDAVYLRAWQDWDHHTLALRYGDTASVDHVGWRVDGPDALAEFERTFTACSIEHHWVEGGAEPGQGDGLRFQSPGGLPFELYWEIDAHREPTEDGRSKLPSHPSRYIGHGIAPRRFDHVNFLTNDVASEQQWMTEMLGIHHRYYVQSRNGHRLGSWLSRTNVSHELALMRSREQNGSRLHHAAYALDSADQLVRAATILAEQGITIEWGPGCHGTSGAIFLYCFEPSGHRIEVWSGGMLIFAPDWQPIEWTPETAPYGLELWGSPVPESYFSYGTEIAARLSSVPTR
jgi:catechol 2,3-dioxygenase